MRVRTVLGLMLVLTGCGRVEVLPPDCGVGPQQTLVGADGDWVPVWGGFGVRWRDISHRVAYVRAGLGPVDTSTPDDLAAVDVELGILGGDWSDGTWWRDVADMDLAWTWVTSDSLVAVQGSTSLRVSNGRELDAPLDDVVLGGWSGEARAGEVVDVAPLGDKEHWAVVLRGTCASTLLPLEIHLVDHLAVRDREGRFYDPARGWTVDGLGGGVSGLTVEDGIARFDVTSLYRAATLTTDIRPDMVSAMRFGQIDTSVSWTLLGWDGGAFSEATVAGGADIASAGEQDTPIPAQEHALEVQGVSDLPVGVPALTSWRIDMNEAEPDGARGRYLRAWEARLVDPEYRVAPGILDVSLVGYASHSSLIQEGDMAYDVSAGVGLLQLDGTARTRGVDAVFRNLDHLGAWIDTHERDL